MMILASQADDDTDDGDASQAPMMDTVHKRVTDDGHSSQMDEGSDSGHIPQKVRMQVWTS